MKTPTSRTKKSGSTAPTNADAPDAAVHSEQSAVAAISGASATPPGVSVPGGTTNTSGESGGAASEASADLVKPMAGPEQTEVMSTAAAAPAVASMPPGEEAPASGTISSDTPERSPETAKDGGGDPAASAAPVVIGMDLAAPGSDMTSLWPTDEEAFKAAYPLTFAFFTSAFHRSWPAGAVPVIRIISRREGFRRGDLVHTIAPTDYAIGEIDPIRMERILGEPLLIVELV